MECCRQRIGQSMTNQQAISSVGYPDWSNWMVVTVAPAAPAAVDDARVLAAAATLAEAVAAATGIHLKCSSSSASKIKDAFKLTLTH